MSDHERGAYTPPTDAPPPPVLVNRAPVLTLWAAVVAERLGHPADTALTLGATVAGTAAHAKARRRHEFPAIGASMGSAA